MTLLLLSEKELRQAVRLDRALVDAIEGGFAALARGEVTMPPVMSIDVPDHDGQVDAKSAYVRGLPRFALKIAAGFPNNRLAGLPSGWGMICVISAATGRGEALLLDNGYLTDIRTAAAGAVAARHLAAPQASTVGIVGAGVQARLQLEALRLVRPVTRAVVWARDKAQGATFATEMTAQLGIPVEASSSLEQTVRQSQILVTTTAATQPLVEAGWLYPGLHITAMGSDAENKNELVPAVLGNADRVVCDRRTQCERLGELHHAIAQGIAFAEDAVVELGDVIIGKSPGRRAEGDITVCDLTGTGVQDSVIANLAFERALARGFGQSFAG
jgi:ectoine utilization protein EutC